MDKDQLLRRISAATEKRKQASPAVVPPPVHISKPSADSKESHVQALLRNKPETDQPVASHSQAAVPTAPAASRVAVPVAVPATPPVQATPPGQPSAEATPQAAQQNPVARPTPPADTPEPSATSELDPRSPLTNGAATMRETVQTPPLAMPDMPDDIPEPFVPPQAPPEVTLQAPAQQPEQVEAREDAAFVQAEAVEAHDGDDGAALTFRPAPREPEVVHAERRMKKEERPEAYVVACTGNHAIIQGSTNCVDTLTGLTWAVGRMLSIVVGENRVVAMIYEVEFPGGSFEDTEVSMLRFNVELQGEVKVAEDGSSTFAKGISSYPGVGSVAHQIRAADLASIYAATGESTAEIGSLSQDATIPAFVDISDMLSKHFAVLGSTGCGKSASVSLLLHAAQEMVPDLRTIILDPHNEYSRAFPHAKTVQQNNLDLPFWLLQLEEYVEVLFRGKPVVHEEIDALREFIPEAKIRFRDGEEKLSLRSGTSSSVVTADTPIPYRVQDVLQLIDDEMGLLESRFTKSDLKSLKARIVAHGNDPRYAFMFRSKTISDCAAEVVGNFFRLPGDDTLTTIIQMAGMPSEVVNAVASVLCRLAFELAIAAKGNLKILVVCEEAHRYVPAGQGGFEPTRRAIARIAKEGRKYGAFMAIISQRPSELDATILSQCSTVFSLRLTNDFDQDLIRRAISSSSANTISFISSLANRECIAFGEGMSTPMRMLFRKLPKSWLPGAEQDVFGNSDEIRTMEQSTAIMNRWRSGAD